MEFWNSVWPRIVSITENVLELKRFYIYNVKMRKRTMWKLKKRFMQLKLSLASLNWANGSGRGEPLAPRGILRGDLSDNFSCRLWKSVLSINWAFVSTGGEIKSPAHRSAKMFFLFFSFFPPLLPGPAAVHKSQAARGKRCQTQHCACLCTQTKTHTDRHAPILP